MSEEPPPEPLARLEQRLERARQQEQAEAGTQRRGGGSEPPRGALGLGLRIGLELVAGLAVGLALGWVFDRLLGTRPWGLIVGFLLGAAAGMLNVFRLAKQIVYGSPPPGGGSSK